MYVLSSTTDVVLDVSILCLLVNFIQNFRMSRNRKVCITAIFGLGVLYVIWTCSGCLKVVLNFAFSCIISSIARLVYTIEYMKANPLRDYESNFGSMSLYHLHSTL